MKLAEGELYFDHAMECAEAQVNGHRLFVFEHPVRASSWQRDSLKRVMGLRGVKCVVFDQCMLGLKSKVMKTHMRKRTRIMTNSMAIYQALTGRLCDRSHVHEPIKG